MQPQPQMLCDNDDDDETDGEYGDDSDDCNTGFEWYKKFKQQELVQC